MALVLVEQETSKGWEIWREIPLEISEVKTNEAYIANRLAQAADEAFVIALDGLNARITLKVT